jgi:glycosyltransferase involved in cell wall biosynthesis
LRVLSVHTRYRQRGGEDAVRDSEVRLLEAHGATVLCLDDDNERIAAMGRLRAAATTLWSAEAHARVARSVREARIDLVHVHNSFPLLSPAVLRAAADAGAAVVQTLHNYRLACPSAVLWRDGAVCEECLGRGFAWPGILHACYRDSGAASAVVAASSALHRLLGTWRRKVDAFIVLSELQRAKMIQAGLPAELLHVKGNTLEADPGPGTGAGGFALFVGRLAAEKGVPTLLRAWRGAMAPSVPLLIVGDGPLAGEVLAAADSGAVRFLGARSPAEVMALIGDAAFLVFPSEWHEAFPRVLVEAMARGTPVLAAGQGAAAEIVVPGRAGRHYTAGDPAALAGAATALAAELAASAALRTSTRALYDARHRPEANLRSLLRIYDAALERAARRRARRGRRGAG